MSKGKTEIRMLDDEMLLKRAYELLYNRFGLEGFVRIIRKLGIQQEDMSLIRDEFEKSDADKIFDELRHLDDSE